jgi:hypothetical protein
MARLDGMGPACSCLELHCVMMSVVEVPQLAVAPAEQPLSHVLLRCCLTHHPPELQPSRVMGRAACQVHGP